MAGVHRRQPHRPGLRLELVGAGELRLDPDDADFRAAVGHTFYFTVVSVSLEVVLGVLVALLLNQEFRGRTFVRALMILPWALPTIVNAVMWRLIYNPEYRQPQRAAHAARPDRVLPLLARRAVERDEHGDLRRRLEELSADRADRARRRCRPSRRSSTRRAIMDGAGAWKRFWNITLPGIIGPLSVALVLRAIEAFKVFDIIYVMTRGGPADTTKTASFFVYQEIFTYLRAGSGAAYALTVTAMSGADDRALCRACCARRERGSMTRTLAATVAGLRRGRGARRLDAGAGALALHHEHHAARDELDRNPAALAAGDARLLALRALFSAYRRDRRATRSCQALRNSLAAAVMATRDRARRSASPPPTASSRVSRPHGAALR